MAGDDGSRSDFEKPALSLDELSPKPKQATESASRPAPVASEPIAAEITKERPAYRQNRAAPPDADLNTQIDPETRTPVLARRDQLAELCALSHEELYDIAVQGQRFFDAKRHDGALKVFEGLTALDPYNADFPRRARGDQTVQERQGQRAGRVRSSDPAA